MTASSDRFFASCPKGLEELLAAELEQLGAESPHAGRAGVAFGGELRVAYRACLWSRLASRVLMPLGEVAAPDPDALYSGVRELVWEDHLSARGTVLVEEVAEFAPLPEHGYDVHTIGGLVLAELGRRPEVGDEVTLGRVRLRIESMDGLSILRVSVHYPVEEAKEP